MRERPLAVDMFSGLGGWALSRHIARVYYPSPSLNVPDLEAAG